MVVVQHTGEISVVNESCGSRGDLLLRHCNLEALPTTIETTFYPDVRGLLSAVLKAEKLPFDVRTGTSEKGSYQAEHKSALSSDWAHLPIPKDAGLLDKLAAAGEQVARLLDANRDARDVVEAVLSPERAKQLGQLRRADGEQLTPDDLKLTITYWGGGKGKWKPRPFLEEEVPGATWESSWGERTGDLFLNGQAHFAHVPEAVWTYQLGGYPVLKKWLGYRQADRRGGKPLTEAERRWLRQMIQRIAALLALGPTLDALYQETAAASFTATELGIRA